MLCTQVPRYRQSVSQPAMPQIAVSTFCSTSCHWPVPLRINHDAILKKTMPPCHTLLILQTRCSNQIYHKWRAIARSWLVWCLGHSCPRTLSPAKDLGLLAADPDQIHTLTDRLPTRGETRKEVSRTEVTYGHCQDFQLISSASQAWHGSCDVIRQSLTAPYLWWLGS